MSAAGVSAARSAYLLEAARTLATGHDITWIDVKKKENAATLPDLTAITMVKTLVNVMANVVEQFFPSALSNAPVVADMSVTSNMSPALFVRVIWLNTHKGEAFINSDYQQFELIDIYLQYPPLNWQDDKYITVVLPTLDVPTGP